MQRKKFWDREMTIAQIIRHRWWATNTQCR